MQRKGFQTSDVAKSRLEKCSVTSQRVLVHIVTFCLLEWNKKMHNKNKNEEHSSEEYRRIWHRKTRIRTP